MRGVEKYASSATLSANQQALGTVSRRNLTHAAKEKITAHAKARK
jgi:hypothetical protein